MRVAGQPDGRLVRVRRRLIRRVLSPQSLPVVAMLAIVGAADGWRLLFLAAIVAAAVAATRLRVGYRAAIGVLMAVALLAIAGWGPTFDRRPPAAPHREDEHHTHTHAHTHRART